MKALTVMTVGPYTGISGGFIPPGNSESNQTTTSFHSYASGATGKTLCRHSFPPNFYTHPNPHSTLSTSEEIFRRATIRFSANPKLSELLSYNSSIGISVDQRGKGRFLFSPGSVQGSSFSTKLAENGVDLLFKGSSRDSNLKRFS